MAPSVQKLEAALIQATNEIFKAEPDATTVNKVRKQAESDLDLDNDFFVSEEWKAKSKTLIKGHVDKLLEGDAHPESVPTTETKNGNGVKRQSEEASPPPAKRRKAMKKESSAESSEEPKPKAKRKAKAKAKVEDSDEEEEEVKPKKKTVVRRRKVKTPISDEDEDMEGIKSSPSAKVESGSEEEVKVTTEDYEASEPAKEESSASPEPTKNEATSNEDTKVKKRSPSEDAVKTEIKTLDEETDYSDVIDEGPKPKRQKKAPVKKEKKEKVKKEPKPRAKKASSPDDPQEAEIKKLQSHLVKCGVRKLWHNELKQHGDDNKAKIRHLRKMLTDIGMDGRFSEAKASEIKQRRELLADLEATKEFAAGWGLESEGRASRGRGKVRKPLKEESDSEEEGVKKPITDEDGDADVKPEDDDDEEEDESFAARSRRARGDLAFLDDSDESD